MRDSFKNGNDNTEDSNLRKSPNKMKSNTEKTNLIDIEEMLKHLNFLNLKLERKKVKISQNKLTILNLHKENETLKGKMKENEDFRQNIIGKLDLFEKEINQKEIQYNEKENILIQNLQEIEQQKSLLEEEYNKKESFLLETITEIQNEKKILEEKYNVVINDFERKNREMEEVNNRIKEIETILEENKKNNGEYLKKLKSDIEILKGKVFSYEKMIETLLYFFKKINSNEENELISIENFNLKMLQQRLIEIENNLIFNNKLIEKINHSNEKKNEDLLESEKLINNLQNQNTEIKYENETLKVQLRELVQLNKTLLFVTSEKFTNKNIEKNNFIDFNNDHSNTIISQSPIPLKREPNELNNKYEILDKGLIEIEKQLMNNRNELTPIRKEEGNMINNNNDNKIYIKNSNSSSTPYKKSEEIEEFNVDNLNDKFNNLRKSSNYVFLKNMKDVFEDGKEVNYKRKLKNK